MLNKTDFKVKFKFKVENCVLQISVDHKFGSNICNILEGSTRPFYFLWFDFVNNMRWAQEEIKLPLGTLTKGSIEVANKDVKAANMKFVARISAKRIHRDILTWRSWKCDPLLHFEMTQYQV